jgi:hypothetical protein
MAKKNRDYPLSETPKPKIDFGIGGIGSNKKYEIGASVNIPIYKGLSIGANKFMGKDEYGKFKNTSYNATLRIPIGKKKKS